MITRRHRVCKKGLADALDRRAWADVLARHELSDADLLDEPPQVVALRWPGPPARGSWPSLRGPRRRGWQPLDRAIFATVTMSSVRPRSRGGSRRAPTRPASPCAVSTSASINSCSSSGSRPIAATDSPPAVASGRWSGNSARGAGTRDGYATRVQGGLRTCATSSSRSRCALAATSSREPSVRQGHDPIRGSAIARPRPGRRGSNHAARATTRQPA